MLNVVLVEPEIPANTGNIGRTCVVSGTRLHLIKPLGFSLDEKALRRAGMAYWESLDVRVYDSWDEFLQVNSLMTETGNVKAQKLHLLTKKAKRTYCDATYRDGDFIVFGKESTGLDENLLASLAESCERIPMLKDEEALINAQTWASPAYNHEALLQQDICGNFINPEDYHISALNLSNAVAIVLYEALRQTGFEGM